LGRNNQVKAFYHSGGIFPEIFNSPSGETTDQIKKS